MEYLQITSDSRRGMNPAGEGRDWRHLHPVALAGFVVMAVLAWGGSILFLDGPGGPVELLGPLIVLLSGLGFGLIFGAKASGSRPLTYRTAALVAWIATTIGAFAALPFARFIYDPLTWLEFSVAGGALTGIAAAIGGLFGWEFREGLR